MRKENLRGVRGIAGILFLVLHVGKTGNKLLRCDAERIAEINRVERLDIPRDYHDVVGGFVEDNDIAFAIVNDPARRVNGFAQESVGIGIVFVSVVKNL